MLRYVIREREYPYDVSPMYKIVPGSPMIEPIQKYDVDKSENLEAFLEKIKKPVIECDIILKAKVYQHPRRCCPESTNQCPHLGTNQAEPRLLDVDIE